MRFHLIFGDREERCISMDLFLLSNYPTVLFAGTKCFSVTGRCWGHSSFLSLKDLRDASKGFLVNDTLIVQAEVSAISTVKNFSK